jgi:Family of unknown function (DUF5335)
MATSRAILKPEWPAFFNRISDSLLGKRVEIEAASLDLGDQILAEWVPLLGITYDSRDDLLDVSLSGLNHLIRSPRQIQAMEGPLGVELLAVVAADGVKHVLRLKEPVMLPSPAAAGRRT